MKPYSQIFFWDGEKLLRMLSLAKRRKEYILGYIEVINTYQGIVTDQEIELVNLQVEACLRANEFKELQKENQDLCDRLNLCGG